jgi:integrase
MKSSKVLTAIVVEKAKATPGARREIFDGPGGISGFGLRIGESGAKSFILLYRFGGRVRRLTIGRHPVVSLADARTKARKALERVEHGIDPAAEEADHKERGRDTVAAWVEKFIERWAKPRNRTWRPIEQMFGRDVLPRWGERPITSITKRDVLAMLDEIVDRGSPIAANRTLAHVAKFTKWLVDRGVLQVDFAAGVKMPAPERSRTRRLSHDEIAALWAAWDPMGYPFGVIGKVLLLTAQRRGEVASMRWDQLDLRRRVWILEAADTKTEEEHLLPLTDMVIEILAGVPRVDGLPLLFPASRAGSTSAVSGFSKAKATASRLSGVTGWTWHDLRRTCRSELARLGVTSAVGERILNHSGGEGEIERVYNVHNYLPEMRRALEMWSGEVARIVTAEPAKVMALAAARA